MLYFLIISVYFILDWLLTQWYKYNKYTMKCLDLGSRFKFCLQIILNVFILYYIILYINVLKINHHRTLPTLTIILSIKWIKWTTLTRWEWFNYKNSTNNSTTTTNNTTRKINHSPTITGVHSRIRLNLSTKKTSPTTTTTTATNKDVLTN